MQTKENGTIRFLYQSAPGRLLLKLLVSKRISRCGGFLLSSCVSKPLIPYYIKKHAIDMGDYVPCRYSSFNDFFIRKRRAVEFDTEPSHLISPCDGYLSIYPIDRDSRYMLKNVSYSLSALLEDEALAQKYQNGLCFIFRLAPDNYHRYHFIDDGTKGQSRKLGGVLHCVRPIAAERYPIYVQNSREYTVLHTVHFGEVVQMEIGALLVGKIHNHHQDGTIRKGEEKGYFEFGGSTIILLFEEKTVKADDRIPLSPEGTETKVRAGEKIGCAVK